MAWPDAKKTELRFLIAAEGDRRRRDGAVRRNEPLVVSYRPAVKVPPVEPCRILEDSVNLPAAATETAFAIGKTPSSLGKYGFRGGAEASEPCLSEAAITSIKEKSFLRDFHESIGIHVQVLYDRIQRFLDALL